MATNSYDPLRKHLEASGQSFSMDNLKALATKNGMQGYTGSDQENATLAASLAKSTPVAPATSSYVSRMPNATPIGNGNYQLDLGASGDGRTPNTKVVDGTGANVNPSPIYGNPARPSEITGYTSPYYSRQGAGTANPSSFGPGDPERTLTEPKSFAQREKEAYDALYPEYSSAIQAIIEDFTGQIDEARARGTNLQGANRAQGAAFGLIGSGNQSRNATSIARSTDKAVGQLNAAKERAISEVISKIHTNAVEMAKMEANQELGAAENAIKLRDKAKMEAKDTVKMFAESGITSEDLREQDPETYDLLKKQIGYENDNYIDALFAGNTPKANILKSWSQGSTMYQMVQNPGESPKVMSYDVGVEIPKKYETSVDAKGNFVAYDPENPEDIIVRKLWQDPTSTAGLGGTYVPGADPGVDAWIRLINNGTAKITSVPAALKTKVAQGLGFAEADVVSSDKFMRDARDIVDRLLTTDRAKLLSIVGPVSSRVKPTFSGEANDVLADINRLRSLLTKDNLKVMKGLGSMSNIEFQNLQAIADSLDVKRSDQGIIDELTRIQTNLNPPAQMSTQNQTSTQPPAGMVRMTGPQGTFDVPADKVEEFKQNGYK